MFHRSHPLLALFVLPAGFAVAVGCSANLTSAEPGDLAPVLDDDAAAPDAGGQLGDGDAGKTTAPPFGSPLCHVTKATCFPDDTAPPPGALPRGGFLCGGEQDAGDAAVGACRVTGATQSTPAVQCQASGAGGDGADCKSGADCSAGFDCVGEPGRCRRYCCSGTCAASGNGKTFCDIVPQAESAIPIPACVPVRGCELLKDSCGMGETCAVVGDGVTSCVKVGTALAGQACDEEHCAGNLSCVGVLGSKKCFQLCSLSATSSCPAGQVCKAFSLIKDTNVGFCEAK